MQRGAIIGSGMMSCGIGYVIALSRFETGPDLSPAPLSASHSRRRTKACAELVEVSALSRKTWCKLTPQCTWSRTLVGAESRPVSAEGGGLRSTASGKAERIYGRLY